MIAYQTYRETPDPDNLGEVILVPDGIRFEADNYVPAATETALPALPVWNAATHRIHWDGAAWQTIALTAQQLAAKAAETTALTAIAADKQQRAVARAILAAIVAGTGTAAERLARVESVCAHYIRHL